MSDYSLKTIRDQFRAQGIFYTPPELAHFIMTLIPENAKRVYDPTCGRGSLLSVFGDDVSKYGQDIDAAAVSDAEKRLVNFHGAVGDVLSDAAFIDERFDAIVANPPFSIKWHGRADGYFAFAPTIPSPSKADFAFIIHIMWMLSDDGTAVVLNSPGIGYRGGRDQILRQWLVEQNVIEGVDLSAINAASIDLHLGSDILVEAPPRYKDINDIIDLGATPRQSVKREKIILAPTSWYDLLPGESILANTVEKFHLPDNIAGEYYLNSSLARNHLEHLHAGHCDPGFNGSTLTLEFTNLNRFHTLRLRPGMRCGQIVLYRVETVPKHRSYATVGNYNGLTQAQGVMG